MAIIALVSILLLAITALVFIVLRAITEFVSIAVAAITVLGTTLLSAILMLESIKNGSYNGVHLVCILVYYQLSRISELY
jgi:uncharacterized membrane protein